GSSSSGSGSSGSGSSGSGSSGSGSVGSSAIESSSIGSSSTRGSSGVRPGGTPRTCPRRVDAVSEAAAWAPTGSGGSGMVPLHSPDAVASFERTGSGVVDPRSDAVSPTCSRARPAAARVALTPSGGRAGTDAVSSTAGGTSCAP
ncbi:MAG: hypothetical protein B7733_26650, partial [Myxococcales bacterium FL481]